MKSFMVNQKIIFRSIILFLSFFIISCKAYSKEIVPYIIDAKFSMEENSEDYSICGVNIFLLNKSEKNIKKINLVFFLFDKDGEPAEGCQNKLEFVVEKNLPASQSCSFCISLDKYLNTIPSEMLFVDYLFLSRIEYEDESVWEDPLGLIAFM